MKWHFTCPDCGCHGTAPEDGIPMCDHHVLSVPMVRDITNTSIILPRKGD